MKDIKIIVATHKKYEMPLDNMYVPIFLGSAVNNAKNGVNYLHDDEGENISDKNFSFCELTGLYWAWKHLKADYIGIVHYRRHFRGSLFGNKFRKVLTSQQADKLLDNVSVLLPKRRHYYIESNMSQYIHSHNSIALTETEFVIKRFYPDYICSFNYIMKKTSGHRFNMFIMKYNIFYDYCKWLFDVLFKVEEKLDISTWSSTEQRVYGYLGERLLDVWIHKNSIKYKDIPYMFMERQNWPKKILKFLIRKMKTGKDTV